MSIDDEILRRGIEAIGLDELRKNHPALAAQIAESATVAAINERTAMRQARYAKIMRVTDDLVSNFLYYDRKEDPELTVEQLNEAVTSGIITPEEIIARFATGIRACTWEV